MVENYPQNNPYTVCVVTAIVRNWQSCMGIALADIPQSCTTMPQVCGQDDIPTLGCLAGQYNDVPGPSWVCLNAVNFIWAGYNITNAMCPSP